eukprot:TRINITY_DN6582_c0_g1_i1.p1 TRINITY_DN6582_c0_g1~~TRINITY_DN6582_c0_g1_i1.p1  ORF type:complete len:346 (+),score=60.81 TRINITY_DN6582_c0_g1_i1:248-1285(+)
MSDKKAKSKKKDDTNDTVNDDQDEESSETSDDGEVTRFGYLEMKEMNKGWRSVFGVLSGGSLYYYKNSSDLQAKGKIDLDRLKVVTQVTGSEKLHTLALMKSDEIMFLASLPDSDELESWRKALEESLSKDKAPPPPTLSAPKRKTGYLKRAKKKVISNTATSTLGKKVLMKYIVNDDTNEVMNALKKVVKQAFSTYTNSDSNMIKSKAEELEKSIIKLSIKVLTLVDSKSITAEELMAADKPLREAFEFLVRVYHGHNRVKKEKIQENLKKAEEQLKKTETILTNVLLPHLNQKNLHRIPTIFGLFTSAEFLEKILNDESIAAELEKLVNIMESYTFSPYHSNV